MTAKLHFVFAGGGTAGHLFPGLAVAERLARDYPQAQITFCGTGKPFERQQVASAGYQYLALPCRPFPRRPREALRFVTDNVSAYYSARRFLRANNVAMVIGLGGYASVAMARAAIRRGVRLVLVEQNAVPGLATRWLSPRAELVFAAFDQVRSRLQSGCRLRITGNPIREEFLALLDRPPLYLRQPASHRRALLVLGGSGGARVLNQHVPLALYKASAAIKDWRIVHQTGPRDVDSTSQLYRKLGLKATVAPFIRNMAHVLLHTDLAISRAGGTTLAELAAAAVPAILLPYPYAADDHQRTNAEAFVADGACRLIDQLDETERLDNQLAATVLELVSDPTLRHRMAEAMQRRARPQAARQIAAAIATYLPSEQLSGVA